MVFICGLRYSKMVELVEMLEAFEYWFIDRSEALLEPP